MSDKDSYTRSKPWRLGGLRELPMRDANRDLEVSFFVSRFLACVCAYALYTAGRCYGCFPLWRPLVVGTRPAMEAVFVINAAGRHRRPHPITDASFPGVIFKVGDGVVEDPSIVASSVGAPFLLVPALRILLPRHPAAPSASPELLCCFSAGLFVEIPEGKGAAGYVGDVRRRVLL